MKSKKSENNLKQLRRDAFDRFMQLEKRELISDEALFTEMKRYYSIYFKGGEIMPTMCIGATCGCFLGGVLGIDPGFGAVVGLVAGMTAAANCPIAACLLGLEAFGPVGAGWFVVAAAISFFCTLPLSLYGNVFSYREIGSAVRKALAFVRRTK